MNNKRRGFDFPICNEATKYEIVAKIGEGSYG
jgi:hypothetical protein